VHLKFRASNGSKRSHNVQAKYFRRRKGFSLFVAFYVMMSHISLGVRLFRSFQAFFQRWWAEKIPNIQAIVRKLVDSGQLEFMYGM
jgi:hypothetical protein